MSAPAPAPIVRHAWPGEAPPPADADALLRRLHQGELFVFGGLPASRRMVRDVRQRLLAALCPEGTELEVPRVRDPLPHLRTLRAALGGSPLVRRAVSDILRALGLPDYTRVDDLRLRLVTQGTEDHPDAAPVYLLHRDTWYGCPQTQINGWIPLFDIGPEQAFAFYPRWFDRPVPNSSSQFDYAEWMERVGWHGDTALSDYPQPIVPVERGPEVRFGFEAGDVLLFSAAQLHQTQPNPIPGTTRYSVDFRFVVEGGPRSPNTDNASRGAQDRMAADFHPLTPAD